MITPEPDPMIARNLVGYGEFPPDPRWPGGAAIAVNFNLNVEGGGESTLANGDKVSEGPLSKTRRVHPSVSSIAVRRRSNQMVPLLTTRSSTA